MSEENKPHVDENQPPAAGNTQQEGLSKSHKVLHWIGWAEGISFLVLLFIAVPLKHWFDQPSLVKSMGPVHGGLFVGLFAKSIQSLVMGELRVRDVFYIMGAAFIPFGPFLMDRVLKRSETAQ